MVGGCVPGGVRESGINHQSKREGNQKMKDVCMSIVYHVAAVAALFVGGLLGWLALVGCLFAGACVCACVAECKKGGRAE
jgi:hypothetical protein